MTWVCDIDIEALSWCCVSAMIVGRSESDVLSIETGGKGGVNDDLLPRLALWLNEELSRSVNIGEGWIDKKFWLLDSSISFSKRFWDVGRVSHCKNCWSIFCFASSWRMLSLRGGIKEIDIIYGLTKEFGLGSL